MYNLSCVLPKLRKAVQRGGGLLIADVNIDIAFENCYIRTCIVVINKLSVCC